MSTRAPTEILRRTYEDCKIPECRLGHIPPASVGDPSTRCPNASLPPGHPDKCIQGKRYGVKPETDPVERPAHYVVPVAGVDIEVGRFIQAAGLSYFEGCAVKYIMRSGKKDPSKRAEDIRKARKCLALTLEDMDE